MIAQEKAAGVLPTPATASNGHSKRSLSRDELACKAFATLRAEFALLGRRLYRSHRVPDGHITYFAERGSHTYTFSQLHDVQAHLVAIESVGASVESDQVLLDQTGVQ